MSVESRLPWFASLAALPERSGAPPPSQAGVVSHQHPDHDTDRWPPA
ncbi:MAG TPA: hypothetical protein VII73_06085 [Caulobacteraceae bacterium]